MNAGEQAMDLTQACEGFEPTIYADAVGIATIGYGHVVLAGEDFSHGVNQHEAIGLLAEDLEKAAASVRRNIDVPLEQYQFDALVCFVFNLGGGALQASTLRRLINRGDLEAVPRELLKWKFAGGRPLRGLLRRRTAEGLLWQGVPAAEAYAIAWSTV